MTLSSSPKLVKGGLVVLNAAGNAVDRSIALQYNPDTLTRSFQVQGAGGDGGGERATPFRLKGPAIETLKVEAEIDATDGLEFPDQNPKVAAAGIGPQLALLEGLVNPRSEALAALNAQSNSGVLEIVPPDAPLVLFVWGRQTVVPVRVTVDGYQPRLPLRMVAAGVAAGLTGAGAEAVVGGAPVAGATAGLAAPAAGVPAAAGVAAGLAAGTSAGLAAPGASRSVPACT